MRFFKTPKLFRASFPGAIWELSKQSSHTLYLTFDDGPYPETTDIILDILQDEGVPATFFCVGQQVEKHPDFYAKILQEGHRVGNHTYAHLDGWKTPVKRYINDVEKAENFISSNLFRPPYGHLKQGQYRRLKKRDYHIVFWSVMAYDFDQELNPDTVIKKLNATVNNGDILVFHDQPKSIELLKVVLPTLISNWKKQGYSFALIPE